MLSILIIDDSDDKIRVLKTLIRGYECLCNGHVEIADSLVTATEKLSTKRYDLVIIDLYLPIEKGDEALPDNGVELLDLIRNDEDIKKPFHVVGITRETITFEHQQAFSKSLWFLLNYDEMSNVWREQLKNQIEYLINSKKMLQDTLEYDYDVAIITALQKPENFWVKEVFSNNWYQVQQPGDDCTTYYATKLTTSRGREIRIITCFANQMASTASSMLTTKVVYNFRPRYLFMTGIAAAVETENIDFGDILVATEVWDGASGKFKDIKDTGKIFQPDYRQKTLNSAFQNIIDQLKDNDDLLNCIYKEYKPTNGKPKGHLAIHTGSMASMPAVIASKDEIEKIKEHSRKLLGIEMESYGMFYAAENAIAPRPVYVASLKSVSDFATIEKSNDYQDYASYTSAALLKYLVLNILNY